MIKINSFEEFDFQKLFGEKINGVQNLARNI